MKKSTLIVLALAIVACVAFYFLDWKKGDKDAAKPLPDASKTAFTFKADDITSITITHPPIQARLPLRSRSKAQVGRLLSRLARLLMTRLPAASQKASRMLASKAHSP